MTEDVDFIYNKKCIYYYKVIKIEIALDSLKGKKIFFFAPFQ